MQTTDNQIKPSRSEYTTNPKPSIFFSFNQAKSKMTLTPDEIKEIQELINNYGKYTKSK